MATTSAMPSASLCARWNADDAPGTFGDLMAWCRISGSLQAGLLLALDGELAEPYRVLTMMSEEAANQIIDAVKLGEAGTAPNALQHAKLRLFFAAAWHAGRGETSTTTSQAATSTAIVSTTGTVALHADMPDVVSMNGVLSQVGNVLVKLMPIAEYDALFPVFRRQCGAPMTEEQEPSRIQMSCYRENVKDKATLYVDFAVWGMHPNRSERLRAMEGVRLDSFGRLVPLVLYGPPDIKAWLKNYRIWRNAAIMMEHVPAETLSHYPDRVQGYADEFPEYLWPLLYQADVRARSEHLLKIARRCREAKQKADDDGVSHPYDPEKPWHYPFELLATAEDKFWNREFREPAKDIMTKLATMDEAVDGDAPVATRASSSTHRATTPSLPIVTTTPPAPKRPRTADETWLPGWKRHNRKNRPLCCGFQHGTCQHTVRGSCSQDDAKSHQCAICLENNHGASQCPNKGKGDTVGILKTRTTKPRRGNGKVTKKGKKP